MREPGQVLRPQAQALGYKSNAHAGQPDPILQLPSEKTAVVTNHHWQSDSEYHWQHPLPAIYLLLWLEDILKFSSPNLLSSHKRVGYACVPLPLSLFTIPVADLFALTSPSSSTHRRPWSMGFPLHQLHSLSSPHCWRLLSHGLHLSPPLFSPGSQLLAPLLRPTGQLFCRPCVLALAAPAL